MENNYRKLMEEIVVPEELEDRVLCAARRQRAAQTGQTGPKRFVDRNR